jgi:hypothetical protein
LIFKPVDKRVSEVFSSLLDRPRMRSPRNDATFVLIRVMAIALSG